MDCDAVKENGYNLAGENMKTILVTGAGGYIGRHVVRAFEKKGAFVIAVDSQPNRFSDTASVKWVVADLLEQPSNLFEKIEKPDACLHLAWRNGFNHNAPSHMEDLSGHFHFLETLIKNGVKQIAVMGTVHEIGYWEGEVTEDTPCNPSSLYAIAKDALRRSLFLIANQNSTTVQWLRAYYICGDDMSSHSIFGKISRAAHEGQESFPFTMGKNLCDFIDIETLCDQIAATVLQDEVTGIINCCSGEPIALAEKVENYIAENRYSISLKYGSFPDRPYDSPGIWGNADKIGKILRNENEKKL